MRVVFLSSPGAGHVSCLVPLAWAFRARDREASLQREVDFAVTLFAPVSRRMAGAAVRLARDWRPELVVYDELGAVGALAAAAIDVPGVYHNYGLVRTRRLWWGLREALLDLYDGYAAAPPAEPAVTLDPAPPSMVSELDGWSVRYVPYSPGAVLPEWLETLPGRRRVAVVLDRDVPVPWRPDPVRRIVEVAACLEAEVVLALRGSPATGIGDLWPNVRVLGPVPLHTLLATCAAVIHHGNSDIALTALAASMPQLLLPYGKHHYIVGDAVRDREIGLVVEPVDLDAGLLRRMLSDRALGAATGDVHAELRKKGLRHADSLPGDARCWARFSAGATRLGVPVKRTRGAVRHVRRRSRACVRRGPAGRRRRPRLPGSRLPGAALRATSGVARPGACGRAPAQCPLCCHTVRAGESAYGGRCDTAGAQVASGSGGVRRVGCGRGPGRRCRRRAGCAA
nr:nucleotide disphospho-sugar-binding domain-containing protein [Krasilnikovia cinnamomea]